MACCSHMFKGQPETSGSKGICPRKADSSDAAIVSRSDLLFLPKIQNSAGQGTDHEDSERRYTSRSCSLPETAK